MAQEAAACRRLWAEVMLRAIADAEADPVGPAGRYIATRDFADVADLAGLDGDAAQDRIARLGRDRLEVARAQHEAALTADAKPRRRGKP
jgi:hypothetical protein